MVLYIFSLDIQVKLSDFKRACGVMGSTRILGICRVVRIEHARLNIGQWTNGKVTLRGKGKIE